MKPTPQKFFTPYTIGLKYGVLFMIISEKKFRKSVTKQILFTDVMENNSTHISKTATKRGTSRYNIDNLKAPLVDYPL